MSLGERSEFLSIESLREVLKSSAIIEKMMKPQKYPKELNMPILPSIIPEEVERSCNDSSNSKNKVDYIYKTEGCVDEGIGSRATS